MPKFVINPQTHRRIQVGGPTWLKLKSSGIKVEQLPEYERTTVVRPIPVKHTPPPSTERLQETLTMPLYTGSRLPEQVAPESLPPYLQREYRRLREENTTSHLVPPTQGWKIMAPKKGTERHELHQKCGDKCFLRPEDEGFPICPKCQNGECRCEIDCRGLLSAYIRARQYKYDDLAKLAEEIRVKKNCPSTPH